MIVFPMQEQIYLCWHHAACMLGVQAAMHMHDGRMPRPRCNAACFTELHQLHAMRAGLIQQAVAAAAAARLPVHVLIRPRGGDFLYSQHEL